LGYRFSVPKKNLSDFENKEHIFFFGLPATSKKGCTIEKKKIIIALINDNNNNKQEL
jgi:hypothetical protein